MSEMRCVTRLKETIHFLGKSVKQVAKDLGISPRHMYSYVDGQVVVPEELRPKFAAYLGCEQEFLFPHPSLWLPTNLEVTTANQPSLPVQQEAEEMKRRDFLLGAGALTLPAIASASDTTLRLAHTLAHPGKLDELGMRSLESIASSAWMLDPGFTRGVSPDAIMYIDKQLEGVTSLLPEASSEYQNRLYSVAGELCMLSAWMLREIGQPDQAIVRLMLALQSATTAGNYALIADIKSRLALLLIHHSGEEAALPYVLSASQYAQLAGSSITPRRRGWVAAIEAECQAGLGNEKRCLSALDIAEAGLNYYDDNDYYVIAFSPAVYSGFRAMSFFKLGRLEDARTEFRQSLSSHLLSIYRKSHKLADLASVEIESTNIEQAATHMSEAVDLAVEVGSSFLNGHILKTRKKLLPYINTVDAVQQLDEQITESGLLTRHNRE
jgi:tetratricopeptide (TPR) repeat protein